MDRYVALLLLPYLAMMGLNTAEWSTASELSAAETRNVWTVLSLFDDIGMDLNTDPEDANDTGSSSSVQWAVVPTSALVPNPSQLRIVPLVQHTAGKLRDLRCAPEPPPPEV